MSYNEALIYDALGRYDEAIGVLKGLLDSTARAGWQVLGWGEAEPGDLPGSAGDHLRRAERDAKAVEVYKQEIDLGGDFVSRGYQGEVDAYRDAHQWKEATAAAAEAAAALPKDKQVQLVYAQELTDTGQGGPRGWRWPMRS